MDDLLVKQQLDHFLDFYKRKGYVFMLVSWDESTQTATIKLFADTAKPVQSITIPTPSLEPLASLSRLAKSVASTEPVKYTL